jgi:hypothetical protein
MARELGVPQEIIDATPTLAPDYKKMPDIANMYFL